MFICLKLFPWPSSTLTAPRPWLSEALIVGHLDNDWRLKLDIRGRTLLVPSLHPRLISTNRKSYCRGGATLQGNRAKESRRRCCKFQTHVNISHLHIFSHTYTHTDAHIRSTYQRRTFTQSHTNIHSLIILWRTIYLILFFDVLLSSFNDYMLDLFMLLMVYKRVRVCLVNGFTLILNEY